MPTHCFGFPIYTATVFILCINLVVNNYNLILIALNSSSSEFTKLLRNDVAYNWYIILIETIMALSAMMSVNIKPTSSFRVFIKFWSNGLTVVLLFLEMLAFLPFTILVYRNDVVNQLWKNITDEEAKKFITTGVLYVFVTISIVCFFALKLCTVVIVFYCGTSSASYFVAQPNHDGEQQTSRLDEENVSSVTPPPRYDLNMIEHAMIHLPTYSPPPSYSDEFKF